MNNRIFKGIALILFGILLCLGDSELNYSIFHSIHHDLPFTIIGVIVGIVGIAMVFWKNSPKEK